MNVRTYDRRMRFFFKIIINLNSTLCAIMVPASQE